MTFCPAGEQFYDDERPYYDDEYGNDPCPTVFPQISLFQHFRSVLNYLFNLLVYVSFAIRIFTMAHAAEFFLSGDSIFMPWR